MKSLLRICILFLSLFFKTNSSSGQCITWLNNVKPPEPLNSAMELLCSKSIISKSQNAASPATGLIPKIDVARCLGKALFTNIDNISFLDNFPTVFPALKSMEINDQRYLKLMLFLEYGDNIAPFSRNYFFANFYSSIQRSDVVKAMLESWNIPPFVLYYDPSSTAKSPIVCDMMVSNKNLPWVQAAIPLGLFSGITQPCGVTGTFFGTDGQMTYAEFYIMLANLLSSTVRYPSIVYSNFFLPNLFFINNLNVPVGLEKGVFHEYSDNGFNISSGGLPLSFSYSYHSNLTEIPVLNNDIELENVYLKPKLQPIGAGWTHSYSIYIKSLEVDNKRPERMIIYWPDGIVQSYLVNETKYETPGVTDKLSINSFTTYNQPAEVTIKKGRTTYLFRNIDPGEFNILSLIQITDAHNNTLDFDYIDGATTYAGHAPKLLAKVTDNYSARFLSFHYDPQTNYLTSVTDPVGRSITFYANQYTHELDSVVNAKNQVTHYYYDAYNIAEDYRTHLLGRIQRPKGNFVDNTYFNRKLKQTQTGNYTIDVAIVPNYNSAWTQQTSKITKTQNNQRLTTNFTFDVFGSITNTATQTDSIERQFNTDNRIIVEHDWTNGFITKYGYDANGFLNKKVVVDDLFSDSTKYEYTNNEYGEVMKIDDYNDQNTSDRITNIHRNNHGDPTDIVENEGLGGEVRHSFYYYESGLLAEYSSPTQYQTQISYNQFGNVAKIDKVTNTIGGPSLSEFYEYDGASRLSSHRGYDSAKTSYYYDNNDNLTDVFEDSDPGGLNLHTQYTYDPNDNHTITISPRGTVTTLTYDFNTDDLIGENDGVNKKQWKYNADGSLDSFITKNNIPFKYDYYSQSLFPGTKLTGLLFSDGITYFQYGDKSRTVYHVNNSYGKENHFWYDGAVQRGKWNRPQDVSTDGFFSGTRDNMNYDYDRMGRPLYVAYPSFGSKNFGFNYYYDFTTKQLAKIEDRNTLSIYATYSYKKDGKPLTEIYGNGDTVFYHYDEYNRLDSIWGKNKGNQLLYSISATLDKSGKHIRENTQIYYQGVQVAAAPTFTNIQNESYRYEPTRNRILSAGDISFVSDGSGNITNSTKPETDYNWNEYGQLTSYFSNGSTVTNYGYDALGNRKKNGDIYYVVDQQNTGNVVIEANQNATPLNVYVYGNGLVARIDPNDNRTFYYHFDFRGSVIAITDQDGQLVKYYQYDPFGVVYNGGGNITWTNPFQYIGKHGVQTDPNGLCYMKARYYQPSTGRFLSEDPKWNTNLFVYAGDDPVNNIDPDGREFNNPEGLPVWERIGQIIYKGFTDPKTWKTAFNVALILDGGELGEVGELNAIDVSKSDIWTSTKSRTAVQRALYHWNEHGGEFPEFLNSKQYVEGAKNFLHNSPEGKLTKLRLNGDILKYEPGTNTFGVMDASGTPRTFFKPTDGLNYWLTQK